MDVAVDRKDGAAVVRLTGRLTGGDDADTVYRAVDEAVNAGERHILVDLENISWTDSSGLGVLMRVHDLLRRTGGSFKLIHVPTRIVRIFEVTKLITVFELYDTEADALASLDR